MILQLLRSINAAPGMSAPTRAKTLGIGRSTLFRALDACETELGMRLNRGREMPGVDVLDWGVLNAERVLSPQTATPPAPAP